MRAIALATLMTAGLSLPVIAEETKADNTILAAHAAELANTAQAKQAQLILAQKGYINVAISGRDDDGRYTGTALKDGKTVWVAVELPKSSAPVTN